MDLDAWYNGLNDQQQELYGDEVFIMPLTILLTQRFTIVLIKE
jgi:hypothetical protein